jgi:hypothetical protein
MTLMEETEEVVKQYLKIATGYSIPIFWESNNTSINSNGTTFILDTGERKFVVTAAHVYRSYIEEKQTGNASNCQLANVPFELEDRLISVSHSTDIATFEISEKEIESLNFTVLRGSNATWPPPRPEENNMVVVSGFPGIERIQTEQDAYNFGYYCFNTPVNSISEKHFGCSFDRSYWRDAIGKGLPPENYDMGGISGAPAIALIKSKDEIVTWRLAGVVYEATASETLGEIMFVHHADLIEPDGTIKETT